MFIIRKFLFLLLLYGGNLSASSNVGFFFEYKNFHLSVVYGESGYYTNENTGKPNNWIENPASFFEAFIRAQLERVKIKDLEKKITLRYELNNESTEELSLSVNWGGEDFFHSYPMRYIGIQKFIELTLPNIITENSYKKGSTICGNGKNSRKVKFVTGAIPSDFANVELISICNNDD